MSQQKVGDKVEVYVTQYEDVFEQTGRETVLYTTGKIMKVTDTYVILKSDETGQLCFISLLKYHLKNA